jgi:heme-degrading monooxygenase HmoA
LATLLEFFDVPPDADDAFLADWRRERGAAGAQLYRAIRDDAPVRFVSVAPGGAYELVHEDGDVDGPGGVILIEPFAVAPGDDQRFLADWQRRRALLAGQRGYLGSRLHHARGHEEVPYVGIGRWSSPLMRHRALQRPDVQAAAGSLRSFPGLYARVLSGP